MYAAPSDMQCYACKATTAGNITLQGKGMYYDDAGSVYDGLWEKGVRHGHGQQSYISDSGDGHNVYNGNWEQDNRYLLFLLFIQVQATRVASSLSPQRSLRLLLSCLKE